MYSYALLSAGKRKTESRLLVFVLRPVDFREVRVRPDSTGWDALFCTGVAVAAGSGSRERYRDTGALRGVL
jgi:hypothetical protein